MLCMVLFRSYLVKILYCCIRGPIRLKAQTSSTCDLVACRYKMNVPFRDKYEVPSNLEQ